MVMKGASHIAAYRQIETVAYWLLLAIVALAPLPFGSNGPESMVALAGLSGLVLVLVSTAALLNPEGLPAFQAPSLTVALTAFAAFAVWGLIQLIPGLPKFLPHPLWAESSRLLGVGGSGGTISIDPELTWHALAETGGFFAIGISAVLLLREPKRRRTACIALALAGGLYAAYGLIVWSSGDCCVAWQQKTAYLGVVTGTFINRNNFATYLGLVALVCLAHILREMGELRHVSARTFGQRLTARLLLLLSRRWLMIVAFFSLITALLFTLSRAGITSSILGAAALVLLLSQARILGTKRRLLHMSVFTGVVALSITAFGSTFVERFANEGVEDAYRTNSWEIIVTGIDASPWLGHGFGTFPEAFPLYRDDRLASRRYWDKAQNTYLELGLDMGIPATAILLFGFGALGVQCVKGLSRRRRERRIFPAIGLAAMVLVGAHSLIDFSMQIPAVATTFAFIMGIAITESGIWRFKDPDQPSASAI